MGRLRVPSAAVVAVTTMVLGVVAGSITAETQDRINARYRIYTRAGLDGPDVARVIAIASEGDAHVATLASDVLAVPSVDPMLTPLVATVPLQLLAYHVAVLKGTDVDQPRNLAKSVTVE